MSILSRLAGKELIYTVVNSDLSECALECSLTDLKCRTDEFTIIIGSYNYLEGLKVVLCTLMYMGSKKEAKDLVTYCETLDRDEWCVVYKDKVWINLGA